MKIRNRPKAIATAAFDPAAQAAFPPAAVDHLETTPLIEELPGQVQSGYQESLPPAQAPEIYGQEGYQETGGYYDEGYGWAQQGDQSQEYPSDGDYGQPAYEQQDMTSVMNGATQEPPVESAPGSEIPPYPEGVQDPAQSGSDYIQEEVPPGTTASQSDQNTDPGSGPGGEVPEPPGIPPPPPLPDE